MVTHHGASISVPHYEFRFESCPENFTMSPELATGWGFEQFFLQFLLVAAHRKFEGIPSLGHWLISSERQIRELPHILMGYKDQTVSN